eukprot:m.233978 g.233978  ORF g.233978 m.233978 type:complete len:118 (+) comp54300_c0_seq1:129-482(+)
MGSTQRADEGSDEEQEAVESRAASAARAHLSSIDRADDKEILAPASLDLSKLIEGKQPVTAAQAAADLKSKEQAAYKVSAADIAVLVDEGELSKEEAERLLRENGNSLIQALTALTN